MTRIYIYKLVADNGGAPCVKDGLLSLAICKPLIRRVAGVDDWLFGFAANSLRTDNRLIYIARITAKLCDGKYYDALEYQGREDCIYQRAADGFFCWRSDARHHGRDDLTHDLGSPPEYSRAHVLLSNDFRYFGANGNDDYKQQYPLIRQAIERLGRGHRVNHDDSLKAEFHALADLLWNRYQTSEIGQPTNPEDTHVCHREGEYEIVAARSSTLRAPSICGKRKPA